MNEYLTLTECAEQTGIHIDTLRRHARNGSLITETRWKSSFAPFRVKRKDLDEWVSKRRTKEFRFELYPGRLQRRGKEAPPITQQEVDSAITEYLTKGGQITHLDAEEEHESTRRVHMNMTFTDFIRIEAAP